MADIVVVDDEEAFLRALKLRLEDLGHTVRTAINGDLGLKLVREALPDLLITDVIMPEREGVETLLEMRRSHPEVKVVVLSGGGRVRKMDFLDIAERLGADAVLANVSRRGLPLKRYQTTKLRRPALLMRTPSPGAALSQWSI